MKAYQPGTFASKAVANLSGRVLWSTANHRRFSFSNDIED